MISNWFSLMRPHYQKCKPSRVDMVSVPLFCRVEMHRNKQSSYNESHEISTQVHCALFCCGYVNNSSWGEQSSYSNHPKAHTVKLGRMTMRKNSHPSLAVLPNPVIWCLSGLSDPTKPSHMALIRPLRPHCSWILWCHPLIIRCATNAKFALDFIGYWKWF